MSVSIVILNGSPCTLAIRVNGYNIVTRHNISDVWVHIAAVVTNHNDGGEEDVVYNVITLYIILCLDVGSKKL